MTNDFLQNNSRVFDSVTGIDITARLIGIAYRFRENGFLEWDIRQEGDIKRRYKVTLEDLNLTNDVTKKVFFAQNDAQNLDPQYTNYDLILASNLLDYISNPLLFLTKIHERLNKNGKLIIFSAYDWNKQYTQKNLWIGGIYDENHKAIFTEDKLKQILSQWFVFETSQEIEMIMKTTERKLEYAQLQCTVWTKK